MRFVVLNRATLWVIIRDAAFGWVDHNAPRLSAALAFYTILSVSPLLVIATPFGAAGSLVVFVVWIYYSSLILFFGVELTHVTATHLGHHIVPSLKVEWISNPKSRTSDGKSNTALARPVHRK